MSFGHHPDDEEPAGTGRSTPSGRTGTVYGGAGNGRQTRGAASVPAAGGDDHRTTGGTTYGSSSAGRGTTYGSGSRETTGTTYGSGGKNGGTTYGSGPAASGTTYGSSASTPTTYGSSPARASGTTYGSASPSSGTTYGAASATYGTAVREPARPTGLGPRSRAAALEDDDPPLPNFGGPPPSGPPGGRKTGGKGGGKRKKILLGLAITTVVGLVLTLVGGTVAYASTDLPRIPKLSQTTTIKYADGGTMATFATQNRVEVKLDQVPVTLQNAVISVEDPDFRENSGVSFRGTARAVWGLVSGNDSAGGGSTITQQYVRNALNLTKERSYKRKAKEIILAQKLGRSMSKDDILAGYLNTIYYGRSALGVQQAAKAYFGKDVKNLTLAEGAVIAAVIKDPTNFDPAIKPDSAQTRWAYVLDQMANKGFITRAERAAAVYPTTSLKPRDTDSSDTTNAWKKGASGVLGQRIEQELVALGFDETTINSGGLVVKTTISSSAQNAAVAASRKYLKGQDPQMATAMASVDPQTGAVKAYYGGERGYGFLDLASAASSHPAGSAFKPYVIAAGIEAGYSIDSKWDGTSGQKFDDRAEPLRNSGDDNSCGKQCSVIDATIKSLNTVFWAMTYDIGAKTVAHLARRAGILTLDGKPTDAYADGGNLNSGIGIGQNSVSVLDQASGYATLADYGTYHEPYFIDSVSDTDGNVLWDHASNTTPATEAFPRDVGRDVSYALQQVYKASKKKILDGRDAAIKTGTQQYRDTDDNAHAWMCGYTPQLATAVWVGGAGKDIKLYDKIKGTIVYGSGIPGSIWQAYMSAALAKQKQLSFEGPLYLGDKPGNAPTEEATPSPDPSASDGDGQDGQGGPSWGDNGQPDPGQTDGTNPDGTNPDGTNPDGTSTTPDGGGIFGGGRNN